MLKDNIAAIETLKTIKTKQLVTLNSLWSNDIKVWDISELFLNLQIKHATMNYQRIQGLILICVVLLDQTFAVHRIAAAAKRNKRALNHNVDERDDEIESDKGIAKRETKVRVKRQLQLLVGLVEFIVKAFTVGRGEKSVIINDFTGGQLWVKCASGDDNFDGRMLQDGEAMGWKFRPNIFGTTLFYCDFSWNGKKAHIDVWTMAIGDDNFITWNVYGLVAPPQINSSKGQTFSWEWFLVRCMNTHDY